MRPAEWKAKRQKIEREMRENKERKGEEGTDPRCFDETEMDAFRALPLPRGVQCLFFFTG